jgi:hypothetical protein
MATIRSIDMMEIDDIFRMGDGYVLNFSTPDMTRFFAIDLNIDIDSEVYCVHGTSKAKRLRALLRAVSNEEAIRVLKALWEYRAVADARFPPEGVTLNAESRFYAVLDRLGDKRSAKTPNSPTGTAVPAFDRSREDTFREELNALHAMNAQARGYAFEGYLRRLFEFYKLEPRGSFKLEGEQIDGSFVLGGQTYLLEAKWHNTLTDIGPLHILQGKVEQKAGWTRGLFVSYAGFSPTAFSAWGSGKRVMCMDGLDIFDALDRHIPLDIVLEKKARRMAESGKAYVQVRELFP